MYLPRWSISLAKQFERELTLSWRILLIFYTIFSKQNDHFYKFYKQIKKNIMMHPLAEQGLE
jgi:hypothetical protein